MGAVTTHILDISIGRPAPGIAVALEVQGFAGSWKTVGRGRTDSDGRCPGLFPPGQQLHVGIYRLSFDTESYFRSQNKPIFYPAISIVFAVHDVKESTTSLCY
jgi:5-hydroxyisourate hydrolase